MGEEKPDEELMGKRKSSPRLSAASLNADILQDNRFRPFYTRAMKKKETCVSMEFENWPCKQGRIKR